MRKIIIDNTIIFFLFQISTAQQRNIKNDTLLEDFYYEIFNENNCAFRISFHYLN